MAKDVKRQLAMNIRLSSEEAERLETLANQRGMSKVALIRLWIQEAADTPSEAWRIRRQLTAALGHLMRRKT
jgi:hypothetical protein